MFRLQMKLLASFVLLAALGCGGSVFVSSNNGQLLVFVSIHPSSANAIQFPNGQVQFFAFGGFNALVASANPLSSVVWTIDRPAFSTLPDSGHAVIDQSGLATCAPGFSGVVQVFATAATNQEQALSAQNATVGRAQLICP